MRARGGGKWRAGGRAAPREDASRQPERRQLEDIPGTEEGSHGGLRARRGRLARGLAVEPECAGAGPAQTQNPGSAGTAQTRAAPAEEEREYFTHRPSSRSGATCSTGRFPDRAPGELESRLGCFFMSSARGTVAVCARVYACARPRTRATSVITIAVRHHTFTLW